MKKGGAGGRKLTNSHPNQMGCKAGNQKSRLTEK